MITNTRYYPRILRFCLRLCVFVSGIVLILASATPPPPRPAADIDETKPHSVVRLVAVTPPIPLSDQHVVTIDRRYQVKSQWLVSSWHTTRSSRYIPKGTILVVDRDIQFGFGFTPLDLTALEGPGSESASSVPLGLSL